MIENISKNSNKTLISVVTCSYNDFKNYYKTIDSVLNQKYENIEYILSDDGSDSFNENVIREYIDNNNKKNYSIKIISQKNNIGTVKNVNNAYKMVSRRQTLSVWYNQ